MKFFLYLLLLLCISTMSLAQLSSLTLVKGKVQANSSGLPLEGASVKRNSTQKGTVSGKDGIFELSVHWNDTLRISYTGFQTKTIVVNEKNSGYVLIQLYENTQALEEVVISNGYQILPRERATGSFVQIDEALLNRRVSSDLISRLEGIASGVSFNRDARGREELAVRGRSTLFSGTEPLIVVDNFPYEGSYENINPNDVASVTVLKDAAAASIWGARAANGVIVITTKKGKQQQKARIDFNSNVGVSSKSNFYYLPRMSTTDFIDVEKMLFDKGVYNSLINNTSRGPALSPAVEVLLQGRSGQIPSARVDSILNAWREIDNRRDLENVANHTPVRQQYSLSISGGTPQSGYYVGLGYDKGISESKAINERRSINARNNFSPVKNLTVNIGVNYVYASSAQGQLPLLSVYPYERLMDDHGNSVTNIRTYRPSFIESRMKEGFLDWSFNPVKEAALTDVTSKVTDLRLSTGVQYKIANGLNAELNYQYQNQGTVGRDYKSPESYFVRNEINRFTQRDAVTGAILGRPVPLGAILTNTFSEINSKNFRAQLNYNKSWKKHQISAMGGYEAREVLSGSSSYRLYGYNEDILTSANINFDSSYRLYPALTRARITEPPRVRNENLDRFRSFFFNTAYTFNGKYTLSGSSRVDQSNYFGVFSNQRAVPLWSSGVKWDIDKEAFFHQRVFSLLEFRATFGYNGNVNKSSTAYTTLLVQGVNIYGQTYSRIQDPPNPNLKWEKSAMANLAIDFELKSGWLSGSMEYYFKRGIDLFGSAKTEGTTGVLNAAVEAEYRGNVASMKGRGFDLTLSTRNVDKRIKWNTIWLLSYNAEKITQYNIVPNVRTGVLPGNGIQPVVGRPVVGIYSFVWKGLDPLTGDPQGMLKGVVSKDYNSLINAPLEDLKFWGSAKPLFFGSLRNEFSIGAFSFSTNLIFKLSYYFRKNSIVYSNLYSLMDGHADYSNRWRQTGDEQKTNVPSAIYPAVSARDYFYTYSEPLIQKGDHLRWQDLQVAYFINQPSIGKFSFRSLQVYGYANNLGLIWKANNSGLDPDSYLAAPTPLSVSIGLKAGF